MLILLLAFGLWMIHLRGRSRWYEEAFAVLYGSLIPEWMIYGTVTPVQGAGAADVHPLLHYFLLQRLDGAGWPVAPGGSLPLRGAGHAHRGAVLAAGGVGFRQGEGIYL